MEIDELKEKYKKLEGKTIAKTIIVKRPEWDVFPVIIEFTDGTSVRLVSYDDFYYQDQEIRTTLLSLWDKAGRSAEYDKKEWKRLISLIESKGIKIQ